jgi:hypothetical protein
MAATAHPSWHPTLVMEEGQVEERGLGGTCWLGAGCQGQQRGSQYWYGNCMLQTHACSQEVPNRQQISQGLLLSQGPAPCPW